MKTVLFWSRITRDNSQEWVLVPGHDNSHVPLSVWKTFNKAFWHWKTSGMLWPLDELDAYQFAAAQLVRTAQSLSTSQPSQTTQPSQPLSTLSTLSTSQPSQPSLHTASPSTYLISAAFRSLMKFRDRVVQPTRETYRALFEQARVHASVAGDPRTPRAEDCTDREWSDPSVTTFDTQAFVESIPVGGICDRIIATRHAAECVYATYMKLDRDARRGLRCWLMADGIWIDAARLYNPAGSPQGYIYRFRHVWAPAFRRACTWTW